MDYVPYSAFIGPLIGIIVIVIVFKYRAALWKHAAQRNGLTLKKAGLWIVLEGPEWKVKVFQNKSYYTFVFTHHSPLPPFHAKRRFLRTKWEEYDGIDTNSADPRTIEGLKKNKELIVKNRMRIKNDGGIIKYTLAARDVLSAKKKFFDVVYGDVKSVHKTLHSR